MSEQTARKNSSPAVIGVLAVILVVCLWIGWSDAGFDVSQTDIREGIRLTIRRLIQLAVQYVIPASIIAFLGREIAIWYRSRT